VRRLAALKTEKGRTEQGFYLIEGEKMLAEALEAGLSPQTVLLSDALRPLWEQRLAGVCPELLVAGSGVIGKVSDAKTPQGIIAAFRLPGNAPLSQSPAVVLDGVQDPGNCGTIWRTCEAAGFRGIAFCGSSAGAFTPKVVRASMGAVFRVPAYTCADTAFCVRELLRDGYDVLATAVDGEDFYQREPMRGKLALVIGSEARGVSRETLGLATRVFRLPMAGKTQSLNAAVAAGIMMYDLYLKEGGASARDRREI